MSDEKIIRLVSDNDDANPVAVRFQDGILELLNALEDELTVAVAVGVLETVKYSVLRINEIEG